MVQILQQCGNKAATNEITLSTSARSRAARRRHHPAARRTSFAPSQRATKRATIGTATTTPSRRSMAKEQSLGTVSRQLPST